MNLVQIRDALVTTLNTGWAHPAIPIFYTNSVQIDIATLGDHFLKCDILFDDAVQINIGPNPNHRIYGTLVLKVFSKDTRGTRTALGYIDELSSLFGFKNLSGVKLQAPRTGWEQQSKGWLSTDLRVSFWADSST